MEKLSKQLLTTLDTDHVQSMYSMEESNVEVFVHSAEPKQGYTFPWHHHRRTQLLCIFAGVALIMTARGRWMVPPGHALFIPVGLEHSIEILSDVSMKSVYVTPRSHSAKEEAPRVVEVTDLARSLLLEAIRLEQAPVGHRKAKLVLSLLVEEISTLPERPLGLPFPSDRRLAALCREYLANPSPNARLDDWAGRLGMSRRTFTRQFRKETGISFTTWRQLASVFACLPQLAEGQPITNVALEAGYESVAAFTTMFRRMLGTPPRAYMINRWTFDRQ